MVERLNHKFDEIVHLQVVYMIKFSVEVMEGILNHLRYSASSKSLPEGMFRNFKTG